jgi:hypothetical protein
MKIFRHRPLILGLFILIGALAIAGCKTPPPVDWNARVGNYTYDQAVIELGPPDKTATLSSGQTVADWITGQRQNGSVSIGTGFFGGGYHSGVGLGVGQTIGGGYSDRVLRLTFGPDNRLVTWSKNY